MPKITSDLVNKSYSGTPLQEFDVPDESGYAPPSIDFEAIDAHRASRGFPPLDDATKRAMFASQTQEKLPRKTITTSEPVEQSAQHLADFERQVVDAKKAKFAGQERLNDAAKRRIEALCGMSRGTREVDIDGNKYLLRTLKSKEHRAAIVAAAEFDGSAHAAFEIRKQLLARAIVQITGYDVELFIGDPSIAARLEFVDELEEPMLIKLYSEYLDLAQTTQERYFVKTESDVKEVMEDLKK